MLAAKVPKNIDRRGLMLVVSSPSGAGKSTLARNLLENDRGFELSVSLTTRPRRPSEIDGVHYHFVSKEEFLRMRDSEQLAEWAVVHENYYGTPLLAVEQALAEGRDMLFDIDWQGAQQLRERMRADVVEIFVLPPSMQELQSRLKRRAEDSDEVIALRLQNARDEIQHWIDYDYIIINEDLDQAFSEIKAIIRAERLRRDRRPGLFDFVSAMLKQKV